MPEGHTLHRLARQHQKAFAGGPVTVQSPQGRFSSAAAISGQTFLKAEAYGKHLFHHYDGGQMVHVHLGLFGKFFRHEEPGTPRETARYLVANEQQWIELTGATACALITPDERQDILDRLGPDPLRRDADPDRAFAALQRRSVSIGRALMDQKVLAGVGNVYRAEILFQHRIHPERPANTITAEEWSAMWETLVVWMKAGVRSGRIVTVSREDAGVPRGRIPTDKARYAYKRDHCMMCGTEIRRWDMAGRWAYACETCQAA